jgi:hypothetical protein
VIAGVVVVSLLAVGAWVWAGLRRSEARFEVEFFSDEAARGFSDRASFELEYVPQVPVPFLHWRWGNSGGVINTPTLKTVTRTVTMKVSDPAVKTLEPGHYQFEVARYLLGAGGYQLQSVVAWPDGKEGRALAMASLDLSYAGSEVFAHDELFPRDDSVPTPGKRFLFRTKDLSRARFLAF